MKVYTGHRTAARFSRAYVVVKENGKSKELPKYDPANHSPDGFEWGYCGSGPACLASSLLKDATGCNCAYQIFKNDVIAHLEDNWQLTEDNVKALVAPIRKEFGHRNGCPNAFKNGKKQW